MLFKFIARIDVQSLNQILVAATASVDVGDDDGSDDDISVWYIVPLSSFMEENYTADGDNDEGFVNESY